MFLERFSRINRFSNIDTKFPAIEIYPQKLSGSSIVLLFASSREFLLKLPGRNDKASH